MNCVIFDMIHSTLNPAILCFTVLYYYGSIKLSDQLIVIRSLHKALVQYVNCWFPAPMQVQGVLKVGLCALCINKLRRVIFVSSLVFSLCFCPEEITKVQLHLELTKALGIVHLTRECVGDVANYKCNQDISNFTFSNIKLVIKNVRISLQSAKNVMSDFLGVADFAVRLEDTHFELYLKVQTVICGRHVVSWLLCSSLDQVVRVQAIQVRALAGDTVVFLGKTHYFHSASLHPRCINGYL